MPTLVSVLTGLEYKICRQSLVWASNAKLSTKCGSHGLSFQNCLMVEEEEMVLLPFKVLRTFVSISYSYSACIIKVYRQVGWEDL